MEFKIEKKEKFNIVGVSKRVPIQFKGENNAIGNAALRFGKKRNTRTVYRVVNL